MNFLAFVITGLALSLQSHADEKVLLKCKNIAENRIINVIESENHQSYVIQLTDLGGKTLAASYILKTDQTIALQIQSLYGTNEQDSYLGEFLTLHGLGKTKEKVFKTLFPEREFSSTLMECNP